MDFIERIFGISPDNGSGWFEMLLLLIPLAWFAADQLLKYRRHRARRRRLNRMRAGRSSEGALLPTWPPG